MKMLTFDDIKTQIKNGNTRTLVNIEQRLTSGEDAHTEFKTSFGDEVIVALVAFANAKGGDVFVGVGDTGKIVGVEIGKETVQHWISEVKNKTTPQLVPDVEIITIENKQIAQFSIAEYPIKPVSIKGRCYKRVANSSQLMSVSEVANMHLQTMNVSWDFYPSSHYTINDIDLPKVESLMQRIRKRNPLFNIESASEFLRKYELQKDDGTISNGCYLLFCKGQSMYTTVQMGLFADEITIKDDDTLQTDILSQVDDIMLFIRKHINKAIIITSTQTENIERWDYPLEALREIVMNMIVHRDYRSPSDSIIKIFPDHIVFFNPGSLQEPITVERLMQNDYVSVLRNKQIANIFKAAGDIEKYGTGVKRVCQMFMDYGLLVPKWEVLPEGMVVTVFIGKNAEIRSSAGDGVDVAENHPENHPENLTERQRDIYEYLKHYPYATIRDIIANVDSATMGGLKHNINVLKQKGLITRIGPDKGGYWQVNEQK